MEADGSGLDVNSIISRLKQYYDVLPNSPGVNRDKFNEALMEAHETITDSEKRHVNRMHEKTNEFRLFKKEQELKIRDWKDRYDKLFYRWREVLRQLDRIQKEGEKIRSERDRLLLCQTTQKDFATFENETEKRKRERRRLRKYFIEEVLFEIMNKITENFNCQMGSVFVSSKNRRFLTTLVCINNVASKEEQLNVKIEIPSNKGIAGYVFRHREAVNVLNPYQDKRFYRKVDRELGTTTKVLLCFPLLETLTDEAMGVIQVLNKKDDGPFSLRDEERLEELSDLISTLLESSSWLFKHEYKRDPFRIQPTSSRSHHSAKSGEEKKKIREKGRSIQVTRIGKDSSGKVTSIGDMQSLRSLVPKKVEDFVVKLNQCWKRAVKQASDLQNEKELLQKDLEHHEKILVVLKTEVKGFKKSLEETTMKLRSQMVDFKHKRKDWREERQKLIRDLKKAKDRLAQLSLPSKSSLGVTGLRKLRVVNNNNNNNNNRMKKRNQSNNNNNNDNNNLNRSFDSSYNNNNNNSNNQYRRRRRSQRHSFGSKTSNNNNMPMINYPPSNRFRSKKKREQQQQQDDEIEEIEGEGEEMVEDGVESTKFLESLRSSSFDEKHIERQQNQHQQPTLDKFKRHSVANPENLSSNIGSSPPVYPTRKKDRDCSNNNNNNNNINKPLKKVYSVSGRFNRSLDHLSSIPRYPDIFELTFTNAPCAMLLLNHRYRIWRVNEKFGELVGNVEEHDLIGLLFSELAVGVDEESLPKLLKFDVVQGLGISIPVTSWKKKKMLEYEKNSSKNKNKKKNKSSRKRLDAIVKVTMQISVIGIEGSRMMNINKKVVKSPMYNLVFYKIKK